MADPQRVVVTGMGAVTPHGLGCETLVEKLRAGQSGIRPIECIDTTGMPVGYAGEVKDFDAEAQLRRPLPNTRDRALKMAYAAGAEALRQAGLVDENDTRVQDDIGCVIGSGLGPCNEAEYAYGCFFTTGWKTMRPTTVPRVMFNSMASSLSIYFGLNGLSHVIASACASGGCAIGYGYQLIKHGASKAVLVGGTDSPLVPASFAAWTNLRVLARHEDPTKASRPFDRDRTGIVLSESAAMLVLESESSARERGATILGEVCGYGFSSDATHLTRPSLEGQVKAIRACLENGGLEPGEVDYINAHGTGTRANDETESVAIQSVFGSRGTDLPISSSKSMLGHAMGASSALEAIVCLLTIRDGVVIPTVNCENPEPDDIGLDFVPLASRRHNVRVAVSNSFGFGGGNCVLAFRKSGQ